MVAWRQTKAKGGRNMQRIFLFAGIVLSCGSMLIGFRSADSAREAAAASLRQPLTALLVTDQFCGTKIDDAGRAELAKTEAVRKWFVVTQQPVPKAIVKVHFHVIQDGNKGVVDDATIATQIDVLNGSFNLRGISFSLASIDRIDNGNWFSGCDAEGPAKRMKKTLRLGTAADLNVYTCEPTKFLGRSAFPWLYANSPFDDGVILHDGLLPGGSDPNFNTGEALVHETGHWMGLYHTFQGGCTGAGDEVEDTPAELTASFAACPVGLDTCSSSGLDPTDNFMDYSGDACWTTFTAGQNDRMASMFAIYRYGQ
jgi:hypothetical protein